MVSIAFGPSIHESCVLYRWANTASTPETCSGLARIPGCSSRNAYIHALLLLDVGIHHLAVVQHYRPAPGAAIRRPTQLLGETRIGIGQEELDCQ